MYGAGGAAVETGMILALTLPKEPPSAGVPLPALWNLDHTGTALPALLPVLTTSPGQGGI
jgi:hypothetical protein